MISRLIPLRRDLIGEHPDTTYRAHNHGPARLPSDITAIVWHATQGYPAENAARWFAAQIPIGQGGPGSTQLVIDNTSKFRTLPDGIEPYGAPPLNYHGVHIECAGVTGWAWKVWWVGHRTEMHRLAVVTAAASIAYDIPLKLLRVDALLAAPIDSRGPVPHGVTLHLYVSNAFHQSTHQDPGAPGSFPVKAALRLARRYRKVMAP